MQVVKSEVQEMLVEMNAINAKEWNDGKLKRKLADLPALAKEKGHKEPNSKAGKALYKSILAALEEEDELEIVDELTEEDEDTEEKVKSSKKGKKGKKAAAKEEEEEDEEDEDDSDEDEDEDEESEDEDEEEEDDEEEEEAPTKKKPAKKKGGKKGGDGSAFKGPGVIATIEELLLGATKKEPITKEELVKALSKKFKERDADAMKKTVGVQVPSRIATERDLEVNVISTENGKAYWATKKKGEKSKK